MFQHSDTPKAVVVGSCSIDLVMGVEEIPQAGQTLMASRSASYLGGKGANQAVALTRMGMQVHLVGSIGMDPYGQQIMRNLHNEGVNVGFIHEDDDYATGTAFVTAAYRKNTIVIVPEANHRLSAAHVGLAERHFEQADVVLLQLESPPDAISEAVRLAKKYRKNIVLYASPATQLSPEITAAVDFIIIKESEVGHAFGGRSHEEILCELAGKLFIRCVDNSTKYSSGGQILHLASPQPVGPHLMGLGDAFTAAFAYGITAGFSTESAVAFGNQLSYFVSQKPGSQTGLPHPREFPEIIRKFRP